MARILIVEPDEQSARLMQWILVEAGHETESVGDTAQALTSDASLARPFTADDLLERLGHLMSDASHDERYVSIAACIAEWSRDQLEGLGRRGWGVPACQDRRHRPRIAAGASIVARSRSVI
jgi:hypothetical protein